MRELTVMALTAALEDYLESIYHLCRFNKAAHSRDIAEALNVHKSTVTAALKSLGQLNLINYSPYEAVTLTSDGRKIAEDVVRRHEALKNFFTEVLMVDSETAEKAACGMEHSIPRVIVDKLVDFADFVKACPHQTETWVENFKKGQLEGRQPAGRCALCKAADSDDRDLAESKKKKETQNG